MEFDLTALLNNGLIAELVAKYLPPRDLISARSVNKAWNQIFQKHYHRRVPVYLEDLDLKLFINNHSPETSGWVQNQGFNIKVNLSEAKRKAALLKLTETFSTQIKGLHFCLEDDEALDPPDLNSLNAVLEPLKSTLENLTLIMEIPEERRRQPPINRTVMQKLRHLAIIPSDIRPLNGEYFYNPKPHRNRLPLPPLTPFCCPYLEHFKIVGYPSLQTLFITSPALIYLSSLELYGSTTSVLEALSTTNFYTPLKRLKLHPEFKHKREEYDFPDFINQVLFKMAASLESFELRFQALFAAGWGEGDDVIPVLKPLDFLRMPNLRFLSISVFGDGRFEEPRNHNWHELQVHFLDTTTILRENFPVLESLNLKSKFISSTLAEIFVSEDQRKNPHRNVKLVQLTFPRTDYKAIERKAFKAFPCAKVEVY